LPRVAGACPIPVWWALTHGPRWMHSTPGPLAFKADEPGERSPWKPRSDRIDGVSGAS
jgi:hypothetical protein